MNPETTFHPEASSDVEEAIAWYLQRSPQAAERLVLELDLTIRKGGFARTTTAG